MEVTQDAVSNGCFKHSSNYKRLRQALFVQFFRFCITLFFTSMLSLNARELSFKKFVSNLGMSQNVRNDRVSRLIRTTTVDCFPN